MIHFLNSDSTISSILNGWLTILLIIFCGIELAFLVTCRMDIFYKLFIYFRVKNKIKKDLPPWWQLNKIYFNSISYYYDSKYIEVPVEVSPDYYPSNLYNCLYVDKFGNIVITDLMTKILDFDTSHGINDNIKKKINRDKILTNMGIR